MDNFKINSNRSFGVVFFAVFLIISLYPLIHSEDLRIWSLIISFVFLILGLTNSIIITPFNLLWFKFGVLLGKFTSPIILGLVFFLVITPIGIIMRLLNKDLLNLKKNNHSSYWIKKSTQKTNMKNQY